MSEFDKSLDIGKIRELMLVDFFRAQGHKPIPIPGKFTGFDFFLANTKEGYEVKQDWKAHYSGNLVVKKLRCMGNHPVSWEQPQIGGSLTQKRSLYLLLQGS